MKFSPVLLALALLPVVGAAGDISTTPKWHVYFSPQGGCTKAAVGAISEAKAHIYVAAYSFTSTPIAAALRDAFRRGVKVEVVLDKGQETERYTSATFIANAGIPTYIDPAHAIMHDKFMVIDGRTVVTGSFNFTQAAEKKNAENLLVIDDPVLAGKYQENWQVHLAHAHPYRSLVTLKSSHGERSRSH